jgi:hypothetical protein
MIILQLERNKETIIIGNIYLPAGNSVEENNEVKECNTKIINILNNIPYSSSIIIGGDWNATMNPSIDRIHISEEGITTHPTTTQPESPILKNITGSYSKFQLVDIFRLTHGEVKQYSHTQATHSNSTTSSRIDFFLVSPNLIHRTIHTGIQDQDIDIKLHHSITTLELQMPIDKATIQYGHNRNITTRKTNFKEATEVQLNKYNAYIETDSKLHKLMTTPVTTSNQLNTLYNYIPTLLKQASRNTLPHITTHSIKKSTKKKHNHYRKLNKECTFLLSIIKHKIDLTNIQLTTKLMSIATKYKIPIEEEKEKMN